MHASTDLVALAEAEEREDHLDEERVKVGLEEGVGALDLHRRLDEDEAEVRHPVRHEAALRPQGQGLQHRL